ncbi:DUF1573 domain-containing protein [Tenacibaculum finnmarkense]|uniref:DUF1573 domain-containing protein n=1 Tax=Tenacibaculum finnmarkense genomovar ulcerans TaxID=2781388 RepID=A0A2I2LDF1_9FLAO|nr:DUF1573 domain-containing protein [Tenacibaculum finnmarkense]ALU76097.1 hypothetical protein AUW17_04315 [Tenacibaculum dicentrarchi]MBE7634436.1 DUF1573 domain-containing protein [Tenacibaculum finnmarkense genomovar ulcerans]MBE7645597.1 DUF1573 domain-containing protein [Tenacibaculum finnmarkense genomovar ulcerans]MBE7647576.1 DUF1573 domain-containing protein [Tenacibaculum finnmarkense genomovar ulcerans]MBE7687643.1 DUF1573 domain-containing protein [Tenacibaculum finnmarkense geno
MKKIAVAIAVVLSTGIFISCGKSDASSKVKKENVENAEKRDVSISKGTASISFDKEEHNFGTVNEGEVVKTTFMVTNSGKTDLVITNAQASCGCTVPVWPKGAIAPGETGEIQVSFNTSGKPNKQSKSITLTTNTVKGKEVIKITGMVTPKKKTA